MIDHVGLFISDYERSKAFYTQMLAPLSYVLLHEVSMEEYTDPNSSRSSATNTIAGFGPAGFRQGVPFQVTQKSGVLGQVHVALRCPSTEIVDAVYQAGLQAGGRDNGPPGPRSFMPPHYYGAFVIDPDGNEIEALCWRERSKEASGHDHEKYSEV